MLTISRFDGSIFDKAYRGFHRKIKILTVDEKDETVKLFGMDWPIRRSQVFVTSKFIRSGAYNQIEARMRPEAVLTMAKILSKNEKTKNGKPKINANIEDSEYNDPLIVGDSQADLPCIESTNALNFLGQFYLSNDNEPAMTVISESIKMSCPDSTLINDIIVESMIMGFMSLVNSYKTFCPTEVCINALVVYWWSLRYFSYTPFIELNKKLRIFINSDILKINKDDEFEQVLDKLGVSESTKRLIEDYFRLSYRLKVENSLGCASAVYVLGDKFMDEVIACATTDNTIQKHLDTCVNKLEQYCNEKTTMGNPTILIPKDLHVRYGALCLACSVKFDIISSEIFIKQTYGYFARQILLGQVEIESEKGSLAVYSILNECHALFLWGFSWTDIIVERQLIKMSDKLEKSYADYDDLKTKAENVNNKLLDVRREMKAAGKRLREADKTIQSQDTRIQSLLAEIQSKSHLVGKEDYDGLKSIIEGLHSTIDEHLESNSEAKRKLAKKDKEIAQLNDKVKSIELDYSELSERYEREKSIYAEMKVDRQFNKIPMKCFVRAIKNHRVAIIGGDMLHNKMLEYGLDDFKYYEAGYKGITYEDLGNMEIIVIITSCVDHATTNSVINISRSHDIPILYYNNKNTDMLIYALFEELMK